MKFRFHEAAEKEFFKAIEYYEECQQGLGLKFSGDWLKNETTLKWL